VITTTLIVGTSPAFLDRRTHSSQALISGVPKSDVAVATGRK
jgi:hypothetical protein